MRIPAHPPWLPGYIQATQTVLIISTTAGLFPDRPHRVSFISDLLALSTARERNAFFPPGPPTECLPHSLFIVFTQVKFTIQQTSTEHL